MKTLKVSDAITYYGSETLKSMIANNHRCLDKYKGELLKRIFIDGCASVAISAAYKIEEERVVPILRFEDNYYEIEKFAENSMPHPSITRGYGIPYGIKISRLMNDGNINGVIDELVEVTKTIYFDDPPELDGFIKDLMHYECILVPGHEPMNGNEAMEFFHIYEKGA